MQRLQERYSRANNRIFETGWETTKVSSMESVICAKLDSCSEFRDALKAMGTTKLVEATTNPFWSCGLTKTTHVKTEFLSGKNMLGKLLLLLRDEKYDSDIIK